MAFAGMLLKSGFEIFFGRKDQQAGEKAQIENAGLQAQTKADLEAKEDEENQRKAKAEATKQTGAPKADEWEE